MKTIINYSIMETIGQIQKFRRNVGALKNSKHSLGTTLYFKKMPTNKIKRFLIFMFERKFCIITHQGKNFLNQRNELIYICRHKNIFKLMNHKTWLTSKVSMCGASSDTNLFSIMRLNMETVRVTPRIY